MANENLHFRVGRWLQLCSCLLLANVVIYVLECAVVYRLDIVCHFIGYESPGQQSAGTLLVVIDSSLGDIGNNGGQVVPKNLKPSLHSCVVFTKASVSRLIVDSLFLSQYFFFLLFPIPVVRRLSLLLVPFGNVVDVLCYQQISSPPSGLMQNLALILSSTW